MAQTRRLKSAHLHLSTSFRWFLTCTFASAVGRNGYAVACAWLLVASDGGSAAVGTFVAIVSLTELLFSPIAGWIADRFNRRYAFVAADCLRMFASAGLLFAASPWLVWSSAVLFSACDRIALTTSQAMIPSVGARLSLSTSNSVSFFCMQAGGLIAAAAIGMLLHSFSAAAAFATIGAAFFLSVCSMIRVADTTDAPRPSKVTQPRAFRINARFIHLACIFALLYGAGTLVSILGAGFVLEELAGDALDFGQLESAWSAGSIVGAILLIPLARLSNRTALLISVLIMIAVLFASLKFSVLPWTLLSFVALGGFYNLGRVAVEVILQKMVPHSALGRSKSLFHCAGVSMGLALFGLVSLTADNFAPSTFFFLYAGLMLTATGLLALLQPRPSRAAHTLDRTTVE